MRGAREHRSCRLYSVPCVFLSAARGQLEHEAQVRSHLVEVHVSVK